MKKFKVQHRDTLWECEIEIDTENVDTIIAIKDMVDFWVGAKDRLENNDGDYIKTFVQQLAREIFYIIAEHDYNLYGVVKEFENREGWCTMEGSYGIKITNVDDLEFKHYEFEVEEVAE